jgi:two-component sensor histidine kinase
MRWLLLFIKLGLFSGVFAQLPDSISLKLNKIESDTGKLGYLLRLADELPKKDAALRLWIANHALQSSPNRQFKGLALHQLAIALHQSGDSDSAIRIFDRAIVELGKAGNPVDQARVFYDLSSVYYNMGNVSSAVIAGESALRGYQAGESSERMARMLNKTGLYYKALGEFDKALDLYFKALSAYDKLNDTTGRALVFTNIGVIYKNQNEFQRALLYHGKSLALHRKTGNLGGQGDCYNNIGVVYKNMDSLNAALKEYDKALRIWKETGNKQKQSFTLNNIGVVYSLKKDYTRALAYLDSSMQIKQAIGEQLTIGSILQNKGDIYLSLKDYDKAQLNYNGALELALKTGAKQDRLAVYKSLAQLYETRGNFNLAYAYLKAASSLNDSLFGMEKLQILNDLETRYYREKSDNEAAHLQAMEELQDSRERVRREQEDQNHRYTRNLAISMGAISLLAILLGLSVYRRYRITRSSRAELELKNRILQETLISKDEKELLLKEIHHRVKNNMQIISSLLRLQAGIIGDDRIKEVFNDTQQRIKSMSLVHEELYKTRDFAGLDVKSFLEKLVKDIYSTYPVNSKVSVQTTISSQYLGIDMLIPLGLLVNEIISNSLKHGFPNGTTGQIDIELTSENNQVALHIRDNGVGNTKESTIQGENQSLGMELIETLNDQLDGEMTLSTVGGYSYRFLFPIRKPVKV